MNKYHGNFLNYSGRSSDKRPVPNNKQLGVQYDDMEEDIFVPAKKSVPIYEAIPSLTNSSTSEKKKAISQILDGNIKQQAETLRFSISYGEENLLADLLSAVYKMDAKHKVNRGLRNTLKDHITNLLWEMGRFYDEPTEFTKDLEKVNKAIKPVNSGINSSAFSSVKELDFLAEGQMGHGIYTVLRFLKGVKVQEHHSSTPNEAIQYGVSNTSVSKQELTALYSKGQGRQVESMLHELAKWAPSSNKWIAIFSKLFEEAYNDHPEKFNGVSYVSEKGLDLSHFGIKTTVQLVNQKSVGEQQRERAKTQTNTLDEFIKIKDPKRTNLSLEKEIRVRGLKQATVLGRSIVYTRKNGKRVVSKKLRIKVPVERPLDFTFTDRYSNRSIPLRRPESFGSISEVFQYFGLGKHQLPEKLGAKVRKIEKSWSFKSTKIRKVFHLLKDGASDLYKINRIMNSFSKKEMETVGLFESVNRNGGGNTSAHRKLNQLKTAVQRFPGGLIPIEYRDAFFNLPKKGETVGQVTDFVNSLPKSHQTMVKDLLSFLNNASTYSDADRFEVGLFIASALFPNTTTGPMTKNQDIVNGSWILGNIAGNYSEIFSGL